MLKNNYEVEVLINGKPAKEYYHKGKNYIEGRKGTSFTIRICNNSNKRKLFIPTIDGLSVMDGSEGGFNSNGYIVQSFSAITIEGWRTSDKEVATFYFSSPEGSYRKRMNKGNNLGVIGIAVIGEKKQIPFGYFNTPINNTSTLTFTPKNYLEFSITPGILMASDTSLNISTTTSSYDYASSSGSSYSQAIGTGWGGIKTSEVSSVNYDREDYPELVFEILYNTRQELEKNGINFKKEPLYVTPQAFPGNYCKPPKN